MTTAGLPRRRYQRGSLRDGGDDWQIRWREDEILPTGTPLGSDDRPLPTGQVLHRARRSRLLRKSEFPTKRLAQRKLDEILREVNREDYRPVPTETFGQFAKSWMTKVMVHHKPSTQRSSKSMIDRHLIPALGALSMREINGEALQTFVTAHTSSAKTVRNLVAVLRSMWTTAESWGYVQHNPFKALRMPAVKTGGAYSFSVEETLAILDAAMGWKSVFLRLLAETGMRPGEAAGLRRQDVQGHMLQVKQSVWQRQVQTPKTANSVRSFAISSGLATALHQHIEDTKGDPNLHGLVFVAESGRPLSMDNVRHRILLPLLQQLGILDRVKASGARAGMYALRHMNMTELSRLGVPLKTIQGRVGHSCGSEVTMHHYIHSVSADDVAAANALGALFNPGGDELPGGAMPPAENTTVHQPNLRTLTVGLCDGCWERLLAPRRHPVPSRPMSKSVHGRE